MIFKPKISHQKPIKPPLKADFNAYFTKKRMIFTPIYKICATPKGPLWVRFPPGVPFFAGYACAYPIFCVNAKIIKLQRRY